MNLTNLSINSSEFLVNKSQVSTLVKSGSMFFMTHILPISIVIALLFSILILYLKQKNDNFETYFQQKLWNFWRFFMLFLAILVVLILIDAGESLLFG